MLGTGRSRDRRRDPRVVCRGVEVLRIRIADPGLVARLACQPMNERLDMQEAGTDRCLGQRFAGFRISRIAQIALELARLLDVELCEVLVAGRSLKGGDGGRDLVGALDRHALGLLQISPDTGA